LSLKKNRPKVIKSQFKVGGRKGWIKGATHFTAGVQCDFSGAGERKKTHPYNGGGGENGRGARVLNELPSKGRGALV